MGTKSAFTITTKLWALSVCLLVSLVTMGAIGYWNSNELVAALKDSDYNDVPLMRDAALVDMLHDGIRANVFHAILVSGSNNKEEIKEVGEESEEFAKNMETYFSNLRKLHAPPEIRAQLDAAEVKIGAYVRSSKSLVDTALAGKTNKAVAALPKFQDQFKELEGDLEKLGNNIEKYLEDGNVQDMAIVRRGNTISIALLLIGFVVGASVSFLIIRDLHRTLKSLTSSLSNESSVVNSSALSLSEASKSLASSTNQQASALQETAASVDEITAMVKKTSENAKNLESSAQESQEAASKGQKSITEMLAAMETISASHAKIMAQVEDSNEKITDIVKVISEIGNKTKVINDIVFQTKLLSFNASVEAARAGEHGKGFAVVAEEVGNLAQMSGNAAKEISDMLGASIEKVENIVTNSKKRVEGLISDGKEKIELGTQIASQCGSALDEIVKNSSDVGSMITEITTAIQEQNQGIQEISKALQLLDQSTHENSTTSKETSNTSDSLLNQATTLRSIVHELENMVTKSSKGKAQFADASSQRGIEAHEQTRTTMSEAKVVDIHRMKKTAAEVKAVTTQPELKKVVGGDLPAEDDPRFDDV